jgi:serine/threonine protein kinase
LLVTERWVVKIADFGTAKLMRTIAPTMVKRHRAFQADSLAWLNPFHRTSAAVDLSSSAARDMENQELTPQMMELTSHIGTLLWEAPEILRGETTYYTSADVYSYGIVLWELMARDLPYDDLKTTWAVRDSVIAGVRPSLAPRAASTGYPPEYTGLVQDCWHADARSRPSFTTIAHQLQKMVSPSGGKS